MLKTVTERLSNYAKLIKYKQVQDGFGMAFQPGECSLK